MSLSSRIILFSMFLPECTLPSPCFRSFISMHVKLLPNALAVWIPLVDDKSSPDVANQRWIISENGWWMEFQLWFVELITTQPAFQDLILKIFTFSCAKDNYVNNFCCISFCFVFILQFYWSSGSCCPSGPGSVVRTLQLVFQTSKWKCLLVKTITFAQLFLVL